MSSVDHVIGVILVVFIVTNDLYNKYLIVVDVQL